MLEFRTSSPSDLWITCTTANISNRAFEGIVHKNVDARNIEIRSYRATSCDRLFLKFKIREQGHTASDFKPYPSFRIHLSRRNNRLSSILYDEWIRAATRLVDQIDREGFAQN